MKKAVSLGSKGYTTVSQPTDLVKIQDQYLGWGEPNLKTRSFEIFAKEDIEVSVNGLESFILLAGDEYEENEDYIESFVVITPDAEFRYTLKF